MKMLRNFLVSVIIIVSDHVFALTWHYKTVNGQSEVELVPAQAFYQTITPTIPETTQGAISIPTTLGGKQVVGIGARAFWKCTGITKVTIPSGVRYISSLAFNGCSGLQEINIPNTMNKVGEQAFYNCSGLQNIELPEGVTSIEEKAFYKATLLTTIIFRGNAPSVDADAFSSVNSACTAYVMPSSKGWGVTIPGTWNGIKIAYLKSVDFNANGGMVSAPTRWLADGSVVGPLPTPSRTGYTFAGWFTATSGGSQICASTTVSANVTYYAHWTANKYTITFDANGGEGGTSTSLSYDTTLGTLPEATRYDFDFGGWWTAANGGLEISSSTKVTGDATYFAHWIDPIPELTGVVTDDMVSEALAGSADSKITSKITTPSLYTEYRQWINSKELSHKAAKASPNAWLSYVLDAPTLMAKVTVLASEDVVIESIEPSNATAGAFDLVVNIADAEIGEGARLAEALGVEGAAELNESVFSSEGLSVTLERTTDGKAKATVTPVGAPPLFFLRVKVK